MNNTLRTMLIFISAVHLLALPSIAQDIPGKDLGSHSAASTLRQKSQKPNKIAEDIWKKRLGETENVFRVSGQILLAGQPSESDFSKVAKAGFKRVLNLNPKKNLGEESRICRRLWLDYYHLSFDDETQLSDDIFNQVRQFLVKSKAVPVLVHCESNDRSAAVWAAYRTLDQGIDLERSIQEARAMGLKTDGYEAKLREYVSRQR